jgi:ribosomal protein L11 methyltransferase
MMRMEKYYFIEALVPLSLEDSLDSLAHAEYSCTGVEEFAIDEARVDEILGERSYSGGDVPESVISEVEDVVKSEGVFKKYYFSSEKEAKTFANFLLIEHGVKSRYIAEDVKDWNEEWKKSYKPIIVGEELEIIPAWDKETYKSESQKKVYIYPGMGFGTGSHETTFLCLKLYLKLLRNQKNTSECLDFGCGSGILGIATKLFDANAKVDLYDIDPQALENSIQNIELNDMSENEFSLLLPKDREQINKKYNLVYANILQNVLLLETDYLTNSLHSGGALILSGLLAGQEEEVIKNYKEKNPNLQFVETIKKGDWVSVLMEMN